MIALALACALQAAAPDSLPLVTLEEALQRGTGLDPSYVAALGGVRDARWQRTTAMTVFIVPAVTVSSSATWYANEAFNIGTGRPSSRIVVAQANASLDLFRGGQRIFDLQRRRAEFESAEASAVETQFRTALFIEADFYDVLAQQELLRVSEERVRRANGQLAVARARKASGGRTRGRSRSF